VLVPAHARAGKERFLDALEAGGGAERDLEAAADEGRARLVGQDRGLLGGSTRSDR
jgi:hypothetical protein